MKIPIKIPFCSFRTNSAEFSRYRTVCYIGALHRFAVTGTKSPTTISGDNISMNCPLPLISFQINKDFASDTMTESYLPKKLKLLFAFLYLYYQIGTRF